MFATVQLMRDKFGERELIQLTDIEQPYTDQINLTKLQAALDAANSEIESYLVGRYELPLQTPPAFLIALACDMARYHACTGAMSDNDPIKNRYETAVKTLKEISKGTIGIGGTPVGEAKPLETSSNNVMVQVGRRDFGGRGW